MVPTTQSSGSLRTAEFRENRDNRDSDHLNLIHKEDVPNKSFQRMRIKPRTAELSRYFLHRV